MTLMIFGAGYSGKAIAASFQGAGFQVTGTTRSMEKVPQLEKAGIRPLLYDGASLTPELEAVLGEATHLVQSVSPGPEGDALPALLRGKLKTLAPNLEWIAFLSTVGVYGDHKGEWVTEETPCKP